MARAMVVLAYNIGAPSGDEPVMALEGTTFVARYDATGAVAAHA